MRFTKRFALAAACLAGSAGAFADCSSAYSSFTSGGIFREQALSESPECFGGGTTTSQVQLNATAGQQFAAISNVLALRSSLIGAPSLAYANAVRGMASGDQGGQWNLWGSVSDEDSRQRYDNLSSSTTKNDFSVVNYVVGADYALSPTMVIGLSAAIDRGNGEGTTTAMGATDNDIDTNGYMFAPYFGMQLTDELSLDLSIGVGEGDLEVDRVNEQDIDRWFAGANLNYNRWMGNWQFGGKAGYLHAEERYSEVDVNGTDLNDSSARNKLDQIQLGTQVGYWLNGFIPFAGLKYLDDVDRSTTQKGITDDPIGEEAWVWELGLNYYSLANGITGGIAYNREESRSNQENHSLVANLNLRF